MTRTPPATLYDDDFFAWTQQQAALLRHMPAADGVEFANVAEEIEDLGRSGLRTMNSYLMRLFERLLKIVHRPESTSQDHWRTEAKAFQASARKAFSPGMRRALDLDEDWRDGVELASLARRDPELSAGLTRTCPIRLDEIVSSDFKLDIVLAKVAAARRAGHDSIAGR